MIPRSLPVYSQAEAAARYLFPPAAFASLNIAPSTIRAWASKGHIHAQGIGPHGAHLYSLADVCQCAQETGHRPRRRAQSDAV